MMGSAIFWVSISWTNMPGRASDTRRDSLLRGEGKIADRGAEGKRGVWWVRFANPRREIEPRMNADGERGCKIEHGGWRMAQRWWVRLVIGGRHGGTEGKGGFVGSWLEVPCPSSRWVRLVNWLRGRWGDGEVGRGACNSWARIVQIPWEVTS